MIFLRDSVKPFCFILGIIIVFTLIITLFNFFDLISYKVVTIFKIIIPIFAMFVGGIMIGIRTKSNGWLAGVKLSGIFILFLILFSLLGLGSSIKLHSIIYFLILMGTTVLGSMLGINKKN